MSRDPLRHVRGQQQPAPGSPYVSLTVIYLSWKFVLCGLLALSPGQGYDTSTDLALNLLHKADDGDPPLSTLTPLFRRLARWDAIYFISSASRGYEYEQEWAFGWGFSRAVALLAKVLFPAGSSAANGLSASAFLISLVSHWLSVLCLYQLALVVQRPQSTRLAFTSACLHIFAPAGAFLVAPFGESLFSFLNFSAMLLYLWSAYDFERFDNRNVLKDLGLIAAGCIFGLSATVRSNGILGGTLFAIDACRLLPTIFQSASSLQGLRYISSLIVGGLLVAAGFALPQFLAFTQYCTATPDVLPLRPWCTSIPPSIYSFVQSHYWNVGFLRYWTFPNLPLFVMAAPMLLCLALSTYWALRNDYTHSVSAKISKTLTVADEKARWHLLRLAVPQGMLTILTLLNFHVQIINRLSSGYPLLYIWLGKLIQDRHKATVFGTSMNLSQWTVRGMIIYALIQGGLFASFLPPA